MMIFFEYLLEWAQKGLGPTGPKWIPGPNRAQMNPLAASRRSQPAQTTNWADSANPANQQIQLSKLDSEASQSEEGEHRIEGIL